MKAGLRNEFADAISPWTLHFNDTVYETKYQKHRLRSSSRSRYIKMNFGLFVLLVVWECLEICMAPKAILSRRNATTQLTLLCLFAGALFLEIVFVYRFFIMRGVLTLIASFAFAFYISYATFWNPPGFMHLYCQTLTP